MDNTVILYEHRYWNGKITIDAIECIKKPITYVPVDKNGFKHNCRSFLRETELNVLSDNKLFSLECDYEKFKQMLIDKQERAIKDKEYSLNKAREWLNDIVNAAEATE